MSSDKGVDALLGVAVGDALGVPYEFLSREEMMNNPARDMIGKGNHMHKVPGRTTAHSLSVLQNLFLLDMT